MVNGIAPRTPVEHISVGEEGERLSIFDLAHHEAHIARVNIGGGSLLSEVQLESHQIILLDEVGESCPVEEIP